MDDKMYKKTTVIMTIAPIVALIAMFTGIIHAALMQPFRADFLFVLCSVLSVVSLGLLIGIMVWSFKNETGREYWVIYFKKQSLKFKGKNHIFTTVQGEHPADKMKSTMLWGIGLVVVIVLAQSLLR